MKIVQINSVPNGSTGKIMMGIHKELLNEGFESYVVWGRGRKSKDSNEIYMNDKIGVYFHVIYSRLTGKTGFASKKSTKKLINRLKIIKPDIIHLHNIHGYYINIQLLFDYIKENNIKVLWTLHDCWSFTGHCSHFETINCNKWQTICEKCPLKNDYPKSLVDTSTWNYLKKKELFLNQNLKIITPSCWLANLVKKSFLNCYSIATIRNGVDINVFQKRKSSFKKKYNIENKIVILGVASIWNSSKGFDDFVSLSKILNKKYVIVLVGVNEKQLKSLPNNIIGITRTENQIELSEIYSSSDIFLNLTYNDNYPTVNIEALACGVPVITYDTGGSVEFTEFVNDDKNKYIISKSVVNKNGIKVIVDSIEKVLINKDYKINIIDRKELDQEKTISEYIKYYKSW